MRTVSVEFDDSLKMAEDHFIEVQKTALGVHSRLRADYVAVLTEKSTNDLHVLTRYSSWLLFGALERSESFTEVTTGIESCKSFDDQTQCPYFQENDVCDCAWNDTRAQTCQMYPGGSRHLQKPYFTCESLSTQEDGDRNSTGFPRVSTSQLTSAWWGNATTVPGFERGAAASGHDSTYDRLRVSSAIPVFQVLYNYDDAKDRVIAQYVAFEADGLFLGYEGCLNGSSTVDWFASEENGAARLRPELCPLGKYGYDPR
jgi:hypothetical protein